MDIQQLDNFFGNCCMYISNPRTIVRISRFSLNPSQSWCYSCHDWWFIILAARHSPRHNTNRVKILPILNNEASSWVTITSRCYGLAMLAYAHHAVCVGGTKDSLTFLDFEDFHLSLLEKGRNFSISSSFSPASQSGIIVFILVGWIWWEADWVDSGMGWKTYGQREF